MRNLLRAYHKDNIDTAFSSYLINTATLNRAPPPVLFVAAQPVYYATHGTNLPSSKLLELNRSKINSCLFLIMMQPQLGIFNV